MEDKKIFRVHSASIIGHEHMRVKKNNQDGIMTREAKISDSSYLFGAICDGCSEGSNNEVGAKLLSSFICWEIPLILSSATPIEELPNTLFMRCIGYLRGIAGQTVTGPPENLVHFVANSLLCTVIGFIVYEECKALVFSAGDGIIILNDTVYRVDQENKPHYLGYHLINRELLRDQGASLPQKFEVISVEDFERMAICSDGFEEEFVSSLWGHNTQISLQRTLNKLSRFKNCFSDDCSVIVVEKIKSLKENERR